VNGAGIARGSAAGIAVTGGVLEQESQELNPGFISRMTRGQPWVTVKLAPALTAAPRCPAARATGSPARPRARTCSACARALSAVMTGSGTVLADDPRLDVRLPGATRQPLRVVLDSQAAHAATGAHPCAAGRRRWSSARHEDAGAQRASRRRRRDRQRWPSSGGSVDSVAALALLRRPAVNELLVECGAGLAGAFFAAGLVDELRLYIAPMLLGRGAHARSRTSRRPLRWRSASNSRSSSGRMSASDLMLRLRPRR
jgi:diaminohydroxyphosphoribosylaminopyrimidine deaminase/5-amino-6-(5-phosphoribosylamino)uracil reductase